MNRKGVILILLALSWPITCLHRLWAGDEVIIRWFASPELWDSAQWYFYHVFGYLSYAMVFFACWLYMGSNLKKDKDVMLLLSSLLVNQVIDIPHYMLFRRGSDVVVIIQAAIVLLAAGKVLLTQIRKR
ncbi:hypothetical protein [Chitinophaga nivalis]|uniref:Uncharacterized protein n=1 Tax=Chitinophaga nivalis TaxID=2991709 RepID=A0ABT3IJ28_9BACT|nr:hypothetical protein [Chitinophaga nivalis]MCW3466489.1 hypothetical protein [Chitinophaga nivalis]MCW3483820.1 hypothetical protein [Chitinophaga nivalis]